MKINRHIKFFVIIVNLKPYLNIYIHIYMLYQMICICSWWQNCLSKFDLLWYLFSSTIDVQNVCKCKLHVRPSYDSAGQEIITEALLDLGANPCKTFCTILYKWFHLVPTGLRISNLIIFMLQPWQQRVLQVITSCQHRQPQWGGNNQQLNNKL